MINPGTIFEESAVFVKFIFVGIFFSLLYCFLSIIKRVLIKDSFSDSFKARYLKKEYKNIKNPLSVNLGKRKAFLNKVIEFVLDIVYFIIITPMMAIFLFGYNNGQVRWYIFVATFLGFYIFKLIFGKILNFIIEYVIFYLLLLFRFIKFIILKPAKRTVKILKGKIKHKKHKKEEQQNRVVLYSYGKSRRI